jgi:hypothetical protein
MEQLRLEVKSGAITVREPFFFGWRKKQLLITQQAGVEEVLARLPALTHQRKELFND